MVLIETNHNNHPIDVGINVNRLRGTRDWEHYIYSKEPYRMVHFLRLDWLHNTINNKLFLDLENKLI